MAGEDARRGICSVCGAEVPVKEAPDGTWLPSEDHVSGPFRQLTFGEPMQDFCPGNDRPVSRLVD